MQDAAHEYLRYAGKPQGHPEGLQAAGGMEIHIPDNGDALSNMDKTASAQRL